MKPGLDYLCTVTFLHEMHILHEMLLRNFFRLYVLCRINCHFIFKQLLLSDLSSLGI